MQTSLKIRFASTAGATEEGKRGMAWTSDLAMAEYFATEYGKRAGDGKIYTAVFAPDHLLACITTRQPVCDRAVGSGRAEAQLTGTHWRRTLTLVKTRRRAP